MKSAKWQCSYFTRYNSEVRRSKDIIKSDECSINVLIEEIIMTNVIIGQNDRMLST